MKISPIQSFHGHTVDLSKLVLISDVKWTFDKSLTLYAELFLDGINIPIKVVGFLLHNINSMQFAMHLPDGSPIDSEAYAAGKYTIKDFKEYQDFNNSLINLVALWSQLKALN